MTDLSRRALLGIGVGAGAGALAVAQSGSATAAPPPATPNVLRLGATAAAGPVAGVAVTRYVTYPGIALVAGTQSPAPTAVTWSVYEGNPKGGSWAANNGWLGTAVEVPAGATVVDITAFTYGTGAGSLVVDRYLPATTGYTESLTGVIAASTAATLRSVTVTVNRKLTVDEGFHAYVFGTSTNHVIRGIRVGYQPSEAGFVPLAPFRAYDSRYKDGKLGRGSRTVYIADRVRPPTGAIVAKDLVPANATAIAYNLGVYATESSGYLAVVPPATHVPSGSSLNWFGSDQSLSNGLSALLDLTDVPARNRVVKVFAGGRGKTHFVIDILGYYL